LRVLEFTDLATSAPTLGIFFDTVPSGNQVDFVGAWSVYPYFASGTILISATVSGLFVVTLR